MKDLMNMLANAGTPERNKDVAERLNGQPTETLALLDTVFKTDSNLDLKHKVLDLADFLSSKLAVATVERAIIDGDFKIRVRALQVAYRLRIDALNDKMTEILVNPRLDFEMRKWALHVLASTDITNQGRLLREIARRQDEDLELRREAIFALTNAVSDEALGTLCALLGDVNEEIRRSSAWALARIRVPESINCLLAALDDSDDQVRDWAIRGLRDMDDSKALEKLSETLLNRSPSEQVRIIRLVVERRSEVIQRAIVMLLDSESSEVRRVAAWALSISPYPPAVPSLRELLNDEDEDVRSYARAALIRSGGIDTSDLRM
ncbi:MAG: HEAT repeat domain-containing protein [Candidatus Thorarchaeota archaeon]